MDIQIRSLNRVPGIKNQKIRQNLRQVLEGLDLHDVELSILFTDDHHIEALNRQYLNREGPTNVLAFPMSRGKEVSAAPGMLGDIVISVDTAAREAEGVGETLEENIFRLLIHGLLHLLGYDHECGLRDARLMAEEERRLLALMIEKT
jgi:rRNA maturation RNase YbeY